MHDKDYKGWVYKCLPELVGQGPTVLQLVVF